VVAVARLVRGVFYDGVDGRLLDDARRVPAGTTEFRLQTTTGVSGGDGERQEDGGGAGTERRRTDRGGAGTTFHCRGGRRAEERRKTGETARDDANLILRLFW